MPRIDPLNTDTANERSKALLQGVEKALGFAPNLMRTLAHSPAALEAYLAFGKALSKGALGPRLREQIEVAVANVNGCDYCLAAHSTIARQLGVEVEELKANREADSADAKTGAALRFARVIVRKQGWVEDQDLQTVREAGYDNGDIAEIVAVVSHSIFSNYFNHIAETEVDFPSLEEETEAA